MEQGFTFSLGVALFMVAIVAWLYIGKFLFISFVKALIAYKEYKYRIKNKINHECIPERMAHVKVMGEKFTIVGQTIQCELLCSCGKHWYSCQDFDDGLSSSLRYYPLPENLWTEVSK